ncbi:MAG: aldo/keto reductase [Bacilli bacterium]|nr:aldo/keto reductase [Bacilli bacterium]
MSRIAQGLMRITNMTENEVYGLICHSLGKGITIFDLADIYGGGKCEELIGRVLLSHPELREKIYLQSKCGISSDTIGYDSSYDNILFRVKKSLERLHTSYLDNLFIHRPDIFMDNEEVARAIRYLMDHKMIRDFSVSNFSSSEIRYLQKELPCPIKYDQVQLGLGNTTMIDQVFNTNLPANKASKEQDDLFFFLKGEGIAIQCWSPFLYGFFEGSIFDESRHPEINACLQKYSEKYHTNKAAIATSFLLRLDPSLVVINGSTSLSHLDEALEGEKINLSREDWYRIYQESGHLLP